MLDTWSAVSCLVSALSPSGKVWLSDSRLGGLGVILTADADSDNAKPSSLLMKGTWQGYCKAI